MVDGFQPGDDSGAVRRADQRSPIAFEFPYRAVIIDGYDEHLPKRLGFLQKLYVTDVQKIEAAVGQHNLAALRMRQAHHPLQLSQIEDLPAGPKLSLAQVGKQLICAHWVSA